MNTLDRTIRVNITLPSELIHALKKYVPKGNLSRFISIAAREKVEKIEKDLELVERNKIFKELVKAPASFKKVKDSARYIKDLRSLDEEREKRMI